MSSSLGRCSHENCKKKLGLINFDCRCEKTFCISHKTPEDHMCTYDYKENGKLTLQKKLIKCTSIKIDPI